MEKTNNIILKKCVGVYKGLEISLKQDAYT